MFLHSESRGLECLDRVARGTLAAIGTFCKLPAVRVRTVAIRALLECDGPLEISARVAGIAAQGRVFSEQREFRRCVIELVGQRRRGNRLPIYGAVARLAGRGERTTVRIAVACIAAIERQASPLGLSVRCNGVALFTFHIAVRAG